MEISENDLIEKYNNFLSQAGNLSEYKDCFPGSEHKDTSTKLGCCP